MSDRKDPDSFVTRREVAQLAGAIFLAIGALSVSTSLLGVFYCFLGGAFFFYASSSRPSQAEQDYKQHLREQEEKEKQSRVK